MDALSVKKHLLYSQLNHFSPANKYLNAIIIFLLMKYNKLVRDRIPEIIKKNGDKAVTHTAGDEEYRNKLKEKLREEVDEFIKDGNEEELADILEVIYALGELNNADKDKLESLRRSKAEKRGGFKKKIILDETR